MIDLKNLIEQMLGKKQKKSEYRTLHALRPYFSSLQTGISIIALTHGKLIVGVSEMHWLHHVRAVAPMIVADINKDHPQLGIKTIRVKLSYQNHSQANGKILPQRYSPPTRVGLTPRERTSLSSIEDQELKKVLVKFLVRCKQPA